MIIDTIVGRALISKGVKARAPTTSDVWKASFRMSRFRLRREGYLCIHRQEGMEAE